MNNKFLKNFKYGTFGLRKEWIDSFLNSPNNFFINNKLGTKQYEAFLYFLKDIELIKNNRTLTDFCRIILNLYSRNEISIWFIFWINLCQNSSLFSFWNHFPPEQYYRKYIIEELTKNYGKYNRYLLNAYNALVSTLERTPIGDLLKQGNVIKKGRERIVIKEGNPDVPFLAICYNLYKFAEYHKKYEFNLEQIENMALSPQKVFSMDTNKVENILKHKFYNEIIQVSLSEEKPLIILNKNLSPLNVLSILIGGNYEI